MSEDDLAFGALGSEPEPPLPDPEPEPEDGGVATVEFGLTVRSISFRRAT
jgi:hypothetical protein